MGSRGHPFREIHHHPFDVVGKDTAPGGEGNDGFEIEIQMDSDESREKLSELIALARKMCFTEKALTAPVPIKVKQNINDIFLNTIKG